MTVDPGTITGLISRYKASSITGLSAGANVASWPDTSGNGYTATQATTANQPTYQTGYIGSQPSVRFTVTGGTGTQLLASAAPTSGATQTVVAVVRSDLAGQQAIRGTTGPGGLGLLFNGYPQGQVILQVPYGTVGSSSSNATPNAAAVISAKFDATGPYSFFINGTAAGSGTATASSMGNSQTTNIGAALNSTSYFNGDVAEILSWNRVLTATELSQVHAYVQDTYGITVSDYSAGSGGGGTTAPGAPTALTATAGNAQAALSWTAPASNGGAAISDYTVQYRTTAGPGTWTTFSHTAQTGTSITVTGLTNGTGYDFHVAAVNSAGTGPYSSTASATPTAGATTTTIAANDTNIVYSPHTWVVDGTGARTNDTGAYLRVAFAGSATSIAANFDQTGANGVPQLEIQIDDQPAYRVNVTGTTTTSLNIPVPTTAWPVHYVRIVVVGFQNFGDRWTSTPVNSSAKLTGFTVGPATVATTLVRKKPYTVLCYGDSITEGYDDLGTGAAIDSRFSWPLQLGNMIGAEVAQVAFSGLGMATASAGVPALPSSYNLHWAGQARSFTTPKQPDLIIIQIGVNDASDITTPATTLLNGLLAATTTSKIVVTVALHQAQWTAAITACTAPSRVTLIDISGWITSTGNASDGVHPLGYVNMIDYAPRLAGQLTPLLTGSSGGTPVTPKRYVNVGGTAKPIG